MKKTIAGIGLAMIAVLLFSLMVDLWYATPLPKPIPPAALKDGVK